MAGSIDTIPDGIVVALSGRLDSANSAETLALITAAWGPETKRVVFDCSAVSFVSSAGLGVMVQAARQAKARGGSAHHHAASPAILQLLRIAGLGAVITAYMPADAPAPTPTASAG